MPLARMDKVPVMAGAGSVDWTMPWGGRVKGAPSSQPLRDGVHESSRLTRQVTRVIGGGLRAASHLEFLKDAAEVVLDGLVAQG